MPAQGRTVARRNTDGLFQQIFDNRGMRESDAGDHHRYHQKRSISGAYALAYGKYQESCNVGGVRFTTIVTEFGTFKIMLDRWAPTDTFLVASLEQIKPRFPVIPDKGRFFEGSSRRSVCLTACSSTARSALSAATRRRTASSAAFRSRPSGRSHPGAGLYRSTPQPPEQ